MGGEGVVAFILPDGGGRIVGTALLSSRADGYARLRDENWADTQEERYRDGWQNGPGNGQILYDEEPEWQPGVSENAAYEQNSYDSQSRGDFFGWNGGYDRQEDFYNEPPAYDPQAYYQQPNYDYREDFDRGPPKDDRWQQQYDSQDYAIDERQRQRQQQHFDRREDLRQRWQEENYYYDQPQSPFGQEEYSQQYQRSGGGYKGRGTYKSSLPQTYFNDPLPRRQFQEDSYDRKRPQEYGGGKSYEGNQQQLQHYRSDGRREAPQYGLQKREQGNQQLTEIVRDEAFGLGPKMERMMMPMPFMGFGMLSPFMGGFGMMNPFLTDFGVDPFVGFRRMDQMMDTFSSEMQATMNLDQNSVESLLEDTREYILADPAVTEMLGDGIRLGQPFFSSSSSNMINGARRTRLQLGIPITGSQGTGRVSLLADEEGIERLEVNVECRVVDVLVGDMRRYKPRKGGSGDVIDANVLEKEVY